MPNSHLKWGHHRIVEIVRGSEEILLPLVVMGELLYGFRYGSRPERNTRESFTPFSTTLTFRSQP